MRNVQAHTQQKTPLTGRVHLQSYGFADAVKAMALEPGDVMIWNWGQTSEVVSVDSVSAHYLTITEKTKTGYQGERRFKKDRLVGVVKAVYDRVSQAEAGGSRV